MLTNVFKPAKKYEIEFNTSYSPGGVYFNQLKSVSSSTGSRQDIIQTLIIIPLIYFLK